MLAGHCHIEPEPISKKEKERPTIPSDAFIIDAVSPAVMAYTINSSVSIRKTSYKEKKSEE
ncbi:MAG: hypothetical protein COC09_06005 [Gammaproteobacteria bacterium]|nr:MAG: hypothetical protein COC09_06005 [Gammaproteobacteria bacterium]